MPRQELYLIGFTNTQITGSKLPSKKHCLSGLFCCNLRFVNLSLYESSRLVVDECLMLWRKAHISTRDSSHCINKSKKIIRKLEKIREEHKKQMKTY